MSPPTQQIESQVFEIVRPISNKSTLLITSLLVAANTIQFISNFITFAGGIAISKDLGKTVGPGEANWMPAAYPLTQSAFVLITGRLGEIYGHARLALLGCLIFGIFSLVNTFCRSYDLFIMARALTGVGGGLFMPNAVSIITTMIPPGKSRNLCLGFFAASPPLGGMIGALLTGANSACSYETLTLLHVVYSAVSTSLVFAWLVIILPKEIPVDAKGTLDYIGAFLGVGSLLLFNIVCNQAPSAGWSSPFTISCLVVTGVLAVAFVVWESRYAKDPVMPLSIFKTASFSALIWVVLFGYMSFGVMLWYSVQWQQVLQGVSVLNTGINFVPFGIASLIAVFVAAWLIPRLAAQWIMAIGVGVILVANILLITMPIRQTYWAQLFPAMVISGFCPDFVYVAAQVIASNSVGRQQQGIASSLIGTLNLYGTSLGLGLAAIVETQVAARLGKSSSGRDSGDKEHEANAFRAALCFAAGVALIGLFLDVLFVKMPKDEREGWDSDTDIVEVAPTFPVVAPTDAARV